MKKILIGSTALLAAGIVASPSFGQEALSASNLDLSLGGTMDMTVHYRSKNPGVSDTDKERNHAFDLDGELHISGETTTDAGLSFGFEVEFEVAGAGAAAGGDNIDQNWIWVDGRFGKVTMGGVASKALDSAGDTATYSGVGLLSGDTNNNEAGLGDGISAPGAGGIGEANKIIWELPAMGGLQININYTPDSTTDTTAITDSDDASAGDKDLLIALEYTGGEDVTYEIELSYASTNSEDDTVDTDIESDRRWRIGAELGIGDFDIGGYWRRYNEYAEETTPTEERVGTGLFAQYVTGDWTIGVSFARGVADEMSAGSPNTKDGEDKATRSDIGVTYVLNDDMTVKAGYRNTEHSDDANLATDENDTNSLDLKFEWDVADGLEFDIGYQNFRYSHHDGLSTSACGLVTL